LRYTLSFLFALCISAAVAAENADSLFFISPQSATGYSGISVSKLGDNLPAWIPPTTAGQAKAAANAAEKSSSMISIGESNLGVNVTFSGYPDKIITSATTIGFFKETPSSSLSLLNAVSDSFPQGDSILQANGAPSSVNEATSLTHIRVGTGLRFNTYPIMKQYDFLPFPINPFVGANIMIDASFGTTKINPGDSIILPDSGLGIFDSTYHRFFLDAGFAFPVGIEFFPLKKTDIPVLKDMGVSFIYTFYALYRTIAFPGLTVNPYSDYLNNQSNNNNNSNNSSNNNSGNNNSGNNVSDSTSNNSGNNSSGSNGKSNNNIPLWTGWQKISSKSEFRVSLEFMF
jgi:hypothetical protein